MTKLSPDQLAVARLLFALPESDGFVLAGGSALIAHGAVDRATRDIDAFIGARPGVPPGDVQPVAAALSNALREGGWTVVWSRDHQTFVRLIAEREGASVEIDLAVDSPPLFPIELIDELPVLAVQDLAGARSSQFSTVPKGETSRI